MWIQLSRRWRSQEFLTSLVFVQRRRAVDTSVKRRCLRLLVYIDRRASKKTNFVEILLLVRICSLFFLMTRSQTAWGDPDALWRAIGERGNDSARVIILPFDVRVRRTPVGNTIEIKQEKEGGGGEIERERMGVSREGRDAFEFFEKTKSQRWCAGETWRGLRFWVDFSLLYSPVARKYAQ